MYESFYGFTEKPFNLTPDPEFFYASSVHRQALAYLTYGLKERKGFIQITGEIGAGKTTLLRNLLRQMDRSVKTAYVINPAESFPQVLFTILKDLEIPNVSPDRSKVEYLEVLHQYLLDQLDRGAHVVLIFDEAQNLTQPVLEEIRMLSNFETTKEKLLQIVLVGQPELRDLLKAPELRQLRQRISVRHHLNALSASEVRKYILYRLRKAGDRKGEIFSEEACDLIAEYSGGIPRLINILCDACLVMGYVEETRQLDPEKVTEVLEEYRNEGLFEDEESALEEQAGSGIAVQSPPGILSPDEIIGIERRLDRVEEALMGLDALAESVRGQNEMLHAFRSSIDELNASVNRSQSQPRVPDRPAVDSSQVDRRLAKIESMVEKLSQGSLATGDLSSIPPLSPEADRSVTRVEHLVRLLAGNSERLDRRERELDKVLEDVNIQMGKLRKYLKLSLREEAFRIDDSG